MGIIVKTKKWGNSIGIVIPRRDVESLKIKPEETVVIEIRKKDNVLKELFGAIKFRKSTEEILREARREMKSKWME